jgi:hypothetical protein
MTEAAIFTKNSFNNLLKLPFCLFTFFHRRLLNNYLSCFFVGFVAVIINCYSCSSTAAGTVSYEAVIDGIQWTIELA